MNSKNVEKIRRLVGQVNCGQGSVDCSFFRMHVMRFSVEVNITKPLQSGFLHKLDYSSSWVQFLYERLADFCYCCGCLGHLMNSCTFKVDRGF